MVRRRLTSFCILSASAVVLSLVPSSALASISGEVAFECEARLLDGFPTSAGQGTCEDGIVPALADVTANGLDEDGEPYFVDGIGNAHAEFDYRAECVLEEPALIWFANGQAEATDITAFQGGRLTTADLTVNFEANIVGAKMVILTSNHVLAFDGTGEMAFGNVGGAGNGLVIPLLQANHLCPEGGPMLALVQGQVDLPI